MGKKRRRNFRRLIRLGGPEETAFVKFYNKNVHITRSMDEALCRGSKIWCDQKQSVRYRKIHILLGAEFALYLYRVYLDET